MQQDNFSSRPFPSPASRISRLVIRAAGVKKNLRLLPPADSQTTPPHLQGSGKLPPRSIRRRYTVEHTQPDGFNLWALTPADRAPERTILYLHGGAYVKGLYRQHWRFAALLASRLRAAIVLPEYPLAPLHQAPETFSWVKHIYADLCRQNNPARISIMGDSAGGGLALALAQQLTDSHLHQPRFLALFSPWLDVSLDNPEVSRIEPQEPLLNMPELKKAGRAYAGKLDLHDPRVSPLYGPMDSLPLIQIFVGTDEIMLPDARRLKQLAEAAGSSVHISEIPHLIHSGAIMPLPERQWIISRLQKTLDHL